MLNQNVGYCPFLGFLLTALPNVLGRAYITYMYLQNVKVVQLAPCMFAG